MGTVDKKPISQAFREGFRSRLKEILEHGDQQSAAALLAVHHNTLSRWGTPEYNGMPTIEQVDKLATFAKSSPAWLAFNQGARDPALNRISELLGKALEQDPELVHIIQAWTEAQPNQKGTALAWAKEKCEHPSLAGLLKKLKELSSPPPGTILERNGNIKSLRPPPKPDVVQAAKAAGEDVADYKGRKPEKKIRRVNRRDELALVRGEWDPDAKAKLPHFLGLAAGPGRELQRCEGTWYFRKMRNHRHCHSMRIAGESMADTLKPGDMVIIQALNNGDGETLPVLETGDDKTPLQLLKNSVGQDDICVLSINDEPPTLKRVQYQIHGQDWQLVIVADNPEEWDARPIRKTDTVTFWGKLVALVNDDGEQLVDAEAMRE